MYRLDRMRKQYEQFTAAEGYAIGFHIGNEVYCAMLDRIPRRYTKIQKECSRIGGYGLYINIKNKKFKNELMKKAFLIGTLADIEPTPNTTEGLCLKDLSISHLVKNQEQRTMFVSTRQVTSPSTAKRYKSSTNTQEFVTKRHFANSPSERARGGPGGRSQIVYN